MASLASDIDLCIGGCIRARWQIVVLADIAGMAISAHEVPVLIDAGPVERIAAGNPGARIEKEPFLAALRTRTAVPGNSERLQAPARHPDKVLLKRRDSEGILDFVIMQVAVWSIGADHEFAAPAEENPAHVQVLCTMTKPAMNAGEIR